ncbi:DNA mismatch repair protein MutS [Porphyromonas gulae]|uniref:lysine 5,6-aminomutase reactivase ATPase KamC n=1 Tax=Porphyromonas gulae TaxID=111105 RepID=UPI0026EA1C41|nr:DNA mismatch repair protein MutS [Porphyromonas gulae]
MKLREQISSISGLRYVIDELCILSSVGWRCLMEQEFLTEASDIEELLSRVEIAISYQADQRKERGLDEIAHKLMQLRDIQGTIYSLSDHVVCTDIDFFEIKFLAILSEDIRDLIRFYKLDDLTSPLPDLSHIVSVLDPEEKKIPHFYIYDAYSETLRELRDKLKKETNEDAKIEIRNESLQEEDIVRKQLSRQLSPYAAGLATALELLGAIDLLLAKVKLFLQLGWSKPVSGHSVTNYTGLVHPHVLSLLEEKGEKFQPVDIALPSLPTLITGANMAGKSVLLQGVALAQILYQYGFYVPAQKAEICPVEKVMLSLGDAQDIRQGLSSFGAEMMCLSSIADEAGQGKQLLVLVDEPARTTNPVEGQAIVSGLLAILSRYKIRSLVTTHYGSIDIPCRRLKVRGFREDKVNLPLQVNSLSKCVDYTLEEVSGNDVPHEAIRIAEILGVNEALMAECKQFLNHTK